MKCRQGNHQLDNQSVRLGGRQAVSQSVSATLCQSISTSFTYFICRFIWQSSCSVPPATTNCQLHISSAKTACQTCCPCQYVYQATPTPSQTTAAAGAAATKVNQMSAEPPLRFNGALMLFVISAQMSYPIHRRHPHFLLLPPFPHATFTDDTWQYANVTFVSSQIRQNVDKFFA